MKQKSLIKIQSQSGVALAHSCILAKTSWSRLVGLLNHQQLNEGEALMLEPCNQVHTFFMRFAIDAVFLNHENKIVAISELKPWRLSKIHFKARKVLELPIGTCRKLNVVVGENLEVLAC